MGGMWLIPLNNYNDNVLFLLFSSFYDIISLPKVLKKKSLLTRNNRKNLLAYNGWMDRSIKNKIQKTYIRYKPHLQPWTRTKKKARGVEECLSETIPYNNNLRQYYYHYYSNCLKWRNIFFSYLTTSVFFAK